MQDLMEEDFREPYKLWKATPGPDTNAAMLKALTPTIEGAVRTHVGDPNPNLMSRARLMALQGLQGYDPARGRLQTHMYNHLLGLKRVARKQVQAVRVPERISLDRYHLENATQELANEMGREPTDEEIANRTGFSPRRMARVREYNPAVAEGTMDDATMGGGPIGGVSGPVQERNNTIMDIVYDELDPYHKKIFELSFGYNGRRPMANQDIAAKMNRSPGAISQAKLRIQQMLDEVQELGPLA